MLSCYFKGETRTERRRLFPDPACDYDVVKQVAPTRKRRRCDNQPIPVSELDMHRAMRDFNSLLKGDLPKACYGVDNDHSTTLFDKIDNRKNSWNLSNLQSSLTRAIEKDPNCILMMSLVCMARYISALNIP